MVEKWFVYSEFSSFPISFCSSSIPFPFLSSSPLLAILFSVSHSFSIPFLPLVGVLFLPLFLYTLVLLHMSTYVDFLFFFAWAV